MNEIWGEGPPGLAALGVTAYAILRDLQGRSYRTDTGVFETQSGANLAHYPIALTEAAAVYRADMPVGIAAGDYAYSLYQSTAGALAALGDATFGQGSVIWDGAAAVAQAAVNANVLTLLARLTALRAGYLDNLNIGGLVASASALANVSVATYISANILQQIQRPGTGTESVPVELVFKGTSGSPQDLDASALPTVTLTGSTGNGLLSRLSAWSHAGTGRYTATYTSTSTDALETVSWDVSGTVGGNLRQSTYATQIVAESSTSFTQSDRDTLNTMAGRVPATVSKDADVQTLLGRATAGRALLWDNLSRLDEAISSLPSGSDVAGAVWSHTPRTITVPSTQLASILQGTDLTIQRGSTLVLPLTGLGSLVGRTRLWWTVKYSDREPDSDAVYQIEESTGLVVLDGSPASFPAWGSLVVNDETNGDLTISVDAIGTLLLDPAARLVYDIKVAFGSQCTTLTLGKAVVSGGVTLTLP